MNNSFYLCGFMGVGKTTILNNIKQQTKYECIDLDESIENKYGYIENIFEEKGETFFREIEEKEFFSNQNKFNLISLGGGAIENDNIFENLLKSNQTIYLSPVSYTHLTLPTTVIV